ncbi:hypothetical protein ABZ725_23640 [Streptomyces sp. NPDC006872]|uniref:hypothetical protein n=1 Tax=Streptomyces sp. NPDC006872 TaxID=3155720 RepID=UPI0033CEB5D6
MPQDGRRQDRFRVHPQGARIGGDEILQVVDDVLLQQPSGGVDVPDLQELQRRCRIEAFSR